MHDDNGIGGIPELVVEGETGFAFKSGNVDDLTKTFLKASLVNEINYQSMQQACAKYVDERCGQDAYVRLLSNAYAGLLNDVSMNRGSK